MSTRVEQILRLAEEQAADHRAEARLEAERIVTSARREADAIQHRTNEQGAGHRPESVSDSAHPDGATT
ncbi:hypothetical protein [Micromonospora vulcania]|uniref:Uncharacterized protein n=1 Tax=Micromonospora vulcania TaxID=1441873 RepID=A0ABW1H579_9ACTN